MNIVLKIEGMMCSHCETTVKSALESVNGVISAEVSHENGTAVVSLSKAVPPKRLISAVTAKGYKAAEE